MEPPPVKSLSEYSGWAPTTIPQNNADHCGCVCMDISRKSLNHYGCANTAIPKNNPNHPRWLLDKEEWRICQYTDIENEVHRNGYGIISYTWGRWAKWDQEPKDLPRDLQWKLPVIQGSTSGDFFTVARNAVSTMKTRYVWWDWMCVPQGKDLSDELRKVKGEEVSKQMGIYAGAKKAIVWLHCTDWEKESPVKSLLQNKVQKDSLEKFVESVEKLLDEMQEHEPWLTSGWTLQEGVLLSETVLLDHHGNGLPNPRFLHNDGNASVLDLTAGLTTLAIHIASAFMKASTAHNGVDYDEVVTYITASDNHYQRIACFLSRLLRSGLIGYTKNSPLFILAGKHSRKFSVDADKYWALLGALGLGNVTPPPDYSQELDKVKATFFGHLLNKHQWNLLLVAEPSQNDNNLWRHHWHTRFSDGKYLPLGIFFDVHWKPDLPYLNWVGPTKERAIDAIHMQTPDGKHFAVLKIHGGSALCRQYQQYHTKDGLAYIRVGSVEEVGFRTLLVFPIADLEGTPNKTGMRCILIDSIFRHVKDPVADEWIEVKSKGGMLEGVFRGVIDIWAPEEELTERQYLQKLTLFSGA